jgi:hypothetical protein
MANFDTLYADIKRFHTDTLNGQLSALSVTALIRYSMQLVQSQALTGSEKKALVLQLVNDLVEDSLEESELPEDTKQAINSALVFAPLLIDASVDFAKTYKSGSGCKLCCFS